MAQGRKPSVRYWDTRKAYACYIDGERHFLSRDPDDAPSGPTYLAALEQFRKLLAKDDGKGTDNYLVSALMNQYRAHLWSTRKSGAPGVFEVMARGFTEEFGSKRVCELKPYDVDGWLARQDKWEPDQQGARDHADPRRGELGEEEGLHPDRPAGRACRAAPADPSRA